MIIRLLPLFALVIVSCKNIPKQSVVISSTAPVLPTFVTDSVKKDSDDPAVWINPADPSKSLIIGTDKDLDGALYVFDLEGKVQQDKVVRGLKRPNNVDVEYGLKLKGISTDIAVTTERFTYKLRIFFPARYEAR